MQEKQLDDIDLSFGDVGGIELPDFDINLVDFMPSDETEETRYTLPKAVSMPSEYVCYDNAERMAKELRLDFYDEKFSLILEKYGTIRKAVRRRILWDEITKKNFNMAQKTSQTGSDRGGSTRLKGSTKASSRRNYYMNKIKGASTRTEAGVPF